MLETLIEHMAWADARAHASIAEMPESAARDRAVSIFAHIVAIEHAWLARFEQREIEHAQWPPWSLETAGTLAISSGAGLRSIVTAAGPEGLGATVTYRTRAGAEGRNTLSEILMHVALHGTHHRGQIALLVRDGGGAPASTDFSTYLRERNA